MHILESIILDRTMRRKVFIVTNEYRYLLSVVAGEHQEFVDALPLKNVVI